MKTSDHATRWLISSLLLGAALFQSVEVPVAAEGLQGTNARRDFYAEGLAAVRSNNVLQAISLLSQVPEDDPYFDKAMILAGRDLLAEAGNKPAAGLPLVERAWRKFPDRQETTLAFLRCELLAQTNLSVPPALRSHASTIPSEFRFIASAPNWPDPSRKFSKITLLADLDYLEMLIANAYAYAERRGADWRGALDVVRASLDDETPLDTFAWRLRRVFTIFGDLHSAILAPLADFIPKSTMPFLAVPQGHRVLALRPDRTAFLDTTCPYLEGLDGQPLSEWLRVAAFDVSLASPQSQWRNTVAELRQINYLRAQLKLPLGTNIVLRLGSEDGRQHKEMTLDIPARPPHVSGWPRTRTEVRDDIGILRLAQMAATPAFLKELDDAMAKFRNTRGLVIDVRQNGGGSQDALCTLLPYFMKPDAPMKIVNVTAYRIPARLNHVPAEGFLPSYRRLFPPTSTKWTTTQRAEIEAFLATFHPEWALPPGFSGWHVMAISHATNPKAFYYAHRVVVLCDAGCASATDNFLGAFKGHPNVVLLGTPSTGCSGRMANYRLPNTHIPLTLCQMASFRSTGELYDGRGVAPDILREPRPADHLKSGDSVLDAALEQLRRPSQ
jgi:hypothetical protein